MRTPAIVTAVILLAGALQAQCTPIPNTGCPNANPPQCSGSTQINGVLTLTCLNNGRASTSFTMVGLCEAGPTQISSVTCFNRQCGVIVQAAGAVVIPTNFKAFPVLIPNDPSLVGKSVCVQCFDVITPSACLQISQGLRVTITP